MNKLKNTMNLFGETLQIIRNQAYFKEEFILSLINFFQYIVVL